MIRGRARTLGGMRPRLRSIRVRTRETLRPRQRSSHLRVRGVRVSTQHPRLQDIRVELTAALRRRPRSPGIRTRGDRALVSLRHPRGPRIETRQGLRPRPPNIPIKMRGDPVWTSLPRHRDSPPTSLSAARVLIRQRQFLHRRPGTPYNNTNEERASNWGASPRLRATALVRPYLRPGIPLSGQTPCS